MSISRVYKIINDVDELVYIGSTTQILSKRMVKHRDNAKRGQENKIYIHMRLIGIEHFKIFLVREYKNISKERLKYKEDKYIKKFDTVNKGLNLIYAYGKMCIHDKRRDICKECKGTQICIHNIVRQRCRDCGGSTICIHNNERPQCKECSPAICDICNKLYSKNTIKKHMKTQH